MLIINIALLFEFCLYVCLPLENVILALLSNYVCILYFILCVYNSPYLDYAPYKLVLQKIISNNILLIILTTRKLVTVVL